MGSKGYGRLIAWYTCAICSSHLTTSVRFAKRRSKVMKMA
jgi:hypothetical protein